MDKGDVVTPIHNERSKYMNGDFRQWIDLHKDDKFYVVSVVGNCVRLAKVGFMITTDFLKLA